MDHPFPGLGVMKKKRRGAFWSLKSRVEGQEWRPESREWRLEEEEDSGVVGIWGLGFRIQDLGFRV